MGSLSAEHLDDLRKSGLSAETIAQAGLYSVRPADISKVTAVPGVTSLLAIPYDEDFSRYKVFPTDLKTKTKDGKFRYLQPTKSGVHLYIPHASQPALDDLTIPLGIVEGEKKALKAAQEGIPCVAIGGLWNWLQDGRLMPALTAMPLKGRAIVLYPDSDVWKRPDLLEAVYRLGCALEAEGATLTVCVVPPGPGETKQGLDDFLLQHTTAELHDRPHIPLTHQRFTRARNKAAVRDQFGKTKTPTRRGKKLRDLMARTFPVPHAIVPGIVLEGVMIFAGKPKIGKSRLMLDIAMAASYGGKALGSLPVDAGPVLYLSLEDPERRLQARAQAMLTDGEAPEHFEYETTWPRVDEGGLADLELWIHEHPGARLIVVDTLKRLRPKAKPGQSVYDADYEALQGLADLAHRHEGLAIVVVHHTNKMREVEDFADLISGSTGLPGSADGFAVLRRRRGDGDASLAVVHRDLPEDQEHALRSDPLTGGWTFLGAAQDQPTSPEQRMIIEVLAESLAPLTPKGIAQILSKKPEAVRFLLWKMEQSGLVERVTTGHYALPSAVPAPLPSPLPTTNTTNSTNDANTTNAANGSRSVSARDRDTPEPLAALVGDMKTANARQPAMDMGSRGSVSGVSGVSERGQHLYVVEAIEDDEPMLDEDFEAIPTHANTLTELDDTPERCTCGYPIHPKHKVCFRCRRPRAVVN